MMIGIRIGTKAGDEAAVKIGEMLESNSTLTSLDLDCKIENKMK